MLDGEVHIIKRAVRGDSSAFGLLYDHYQPKIYRFALVKVSHREEAEDLTHQVFLKAWQSIESYQDLGFPFSSWLYRIARNHVVDYYRTKKVTESIDDTDPEKAPVEHSLNSDLLEKLEVERVKNAIRKLKPEYQDVIIMRFVEDLPIRETALALDKSEGAIKLLQHRAIKEIQKMLGENVKY
ncbi:MAG: sigma-70 family RNA polymerase sigma factor [Patescibacteria group bacterium]